MAKLTLTNVSNLNGNPTAAETAINANNAAIEAAMDLTLFRDGTSPNTMTNDLDMNSYRILNLPDAVLPQEPATKAQLDAITGGDYAPLVHTHVVADITDYTSATNSLINAAVAAINASGVPDGDKGDITVTGSGLTWTLDTGVVSTSKMGGDVTTAGKALLDDANAAAQLATLLLPVTLMLLLILLLVS
jgi:hypothetical protein